VQGFTLQVALTDWEFDEEFLSFLDIIIRVGISRQDIRVALK